MKTICGTTAMFPNDAHGPCLTAENHANENTLFVLQYNGIASLVHKILMSMF